MFAFQNSIVIQNSPLGDPLSGRAALLSLGSAALPPSTLRFTNTPQLLPEKRLHRKAEPITQVIPACRAPLKTRIDTDAQRVDTPF